MLLGPLDLSPTYQPDGQLSAQKARAMADIALREGSHFFEWTHKRRRNSYHDLYKTTSLATNRYYSSSLSHLRHLWS